MSAYRGSTPNIGKLPTNLLRCRTFGHLWEEFVPVGVRRPSFGFRYALLCTSCGTERFDIIATTGDVVHRKYYYADGYKLDLPATRDECRVEYKRRRNRTVRRGHLAVAK